MAIGQKEETYYKLLASKLFSISMHIYGKGATWGLYTMEHGDAHAMAWDLGLGGMPIHDYGRPGEFSLFPL